MDTGKGGEVGSDPRGVTALSGLDGGPGPGAAVWERKPSGGQIMPDVGWCLGAKLWGGRKETSAPWAAGLVFRLGMRKLLPQEGQLQLEGHGAGLVSIDSVCPVRKGLVWAQGRARLWSCGSS